MRAAGHLQGKRVDVVKALLLCNLKKGQNAELWPRPLRNRLSLIAGRVAQSLGTSLSLLPTPLFLHQQQLGEKQQ